jgi:O-antigen/teichoic acid export membrane protein
MDEANISRLVSGGFWVGILNFGSRGLGILRLLILARLLSPTDFGIAGLSVLLASISYQAVQPGFHEALVQSGATPDEESLNTTFTLRAGISLVTAGVLFLLAPELAGWFGEPSIQLPLRTLSLYILVSGLRNPGILFFERELDFRPYAIYNGLGDVFNIILAVTVAVLVGNYWAILAGVIGGELAKTILSYALHPYRPQLRLSRRTLKGLYEYGRWIQGSRILALLVTKLDDAFVGRYIGSEALGFYQISFSISQLPVSELSDTISTIAFPAFSKISDSERLVDQFSRAVGLTTLISFPLAAGLAVMSRPIVLIGLGPEWTPVIPLLQTLAMYGAIRSVINVTSSLAKAVGRPDINAKSMIIKLGGLAVLLFPLSDMYGAAGVAAATVIPLIFSVPYYLYALRRSTSRAFLSLFLRRISPPILASGVMTLGVYAIGESLFPNRGAFTGPETIVWLLIGSASGAVLYILLVVVVDGFLKSGLIRDVRRLLRSI